MKSFAGRSSRLLLLVLTVVSALIAADAVEGRGFRGSRRRSSRSRSSRTSQSRSRSRSRTPAVRRPSSSRKSNWGTSSSRKSTTTTKRKSTPKPGKKTLSGRRTSTKKPSVSKADAALARKAKTAGTRFNSRKKALTHFKSKNADKYKAKYEAKPEKRPAHIPKTTTSGSKTYNITYNVDHGGYGYMVDGRWMAYDVMADAAMLDTLMRRNDYYYGPPVAGVRNSHIRSVSRNYGGMPQRRVVYHSTSFLPVFLGVIVVVGIITAAVVLIVISRSAMQKQG